LWALNGNASIGTGTIDGALTVNSALTGALTVKSGGVLGGQGTIAGNVSVANGGMLAPGVAAPSDTFSAMKVIGSASFATGSVFKVNANAAGQADKLALTGVANLTGGTVQVLAAGATFAPSTSYTILTAGSVTGTFDAVSSNLAFLNPSLNYIGNDVVLTLARKSTATFASVAQTPNQSAVAAALDASPASSPLVTAVVGQSAQGAQQAFKALSGEVFGTMQTVQAGQTHSTRNAILGRQRQVSYVDTPGALGVLGFGGPALAYASLDPPLDITASTNRRKAASFAAPQDLIFWTQGHGGFGQVASDGNAAATDSIFGGFISGIDAKVGDAIRAGFTAGYTRSDLKGGASSVGVDSAQVGIYAGGRSGDFHLRGAAAYTFDTINSNRAIAFPGFVDQTHARFSGNVALVFGEVGYGMTFNRVAVEPVAGLSYVHVHTGAFQESGGPAALAGAGTDQNIGYSSLGVRTATVVPIFDGTVLTPRVSLFWQHAFGDINPVAALAFQGTGAGFSTAGVPIAREAALIEGGIDWRFSPTMKIAFDYQGEFAARAHTHMLKGTFSWNY
jgi:outer membrane autotransporter protein